MFGSILGDMGGRVSDLDPSPAALVNSTDEPDDDDETIIVSSQNSFSVVSPLQDCFGRLDRANKKRRTSNQPIHPLHRRSQSLRGIQPLQ